MGPHLQRTQTSCVPWMPRQHSSTWAGSLRPLGSTKMQGTHLISMGKWAVYLQPVLMAGGSRPHRQDPRLRAEPPCCRPGCALPQPRKILVNNNNKQNSQTHGENKVGSSWGPYSGQAPGNIVSLQTKSKHASEPNNTQMLDQSRLYSGA